MTGNPDTLVAWIALFAGLGALATGVGELRAPGGFAQLSKEFERSRVPPFLAGLLLFALGAAVFLAATSAREEGARDWLGLAVSLVGGLAVAVGLLLLAAPDRILAVGRRMAGEGAILAGVAAAAGAALVLAAAARLQPL